MNFRWLQGLLEGSHLAASSVARSLVSRGVIGNMAILIMCQTSKAIHPTQLSWYRASADSCFLIPFESAYSFFPRALINGRREPVAIDFRAGERLLSSGKVSVSKYYNRHTEGFCKFACQYYKLVTFFNCRRSYYYLGGIPRLPVHCGK